MSDTDSAGREREEFCHGCSRNFPESELTAVYTIRQGIEQKEWVCPDCEDEAREYEKPPSRSLHTDSDHGGDSS